MVQIGSLEFRERDGMNVVETERRAIEVVLDWEGI
jgi:hypothetical protein